MVRGIRVTPSKSVAEGERYSLQGLDGGQDGMGGLNMLPLALALTEDVVVSVAGPSSLVLEDF